MTATEKRKWLKCLVSCVIMAGYSSGCGIYMQRHDPTWTAFLLMLAGTFFTVFGLCVWNDVPKSLR